MLSPSKICGNGNLFMPKQSDGTTHPPYVIEKMAATAIVLTLWSKRDPIPLLTSFVLTQTLLAVQQWNILEHVS